MENENDIHFSHIYRKDLINFFKIGRSQKKYSNLDKIERTWLPVSNSCFEHVSPGLIKNLFSVYVPNVLFHLFKKKVIKKIQSTNPDIIHLNSVILLPLVKFLVKNKSLFNCKIILHVRELVDLNNINTYKDEINHISRFVCIDYAVAARILNSCFDINPKQLFIQQNPFKSQINLRPDLNPYFNSSKIKFSIAGVIGKDKGVDFVCESFLNAKLDDAELFIIGKINSYGLSIKKKYSDSNIIWTGEIDNLSNSGAFSYINCLIRGERQFCTGRTVYEALFSGSIALLPGTINEARNDKFLMEFSNQIFFYNPRDIQSFNNSIKKIYDLIKSQNVQLNFQSKSNYQQYSEFFKKIYFELSLV